MVCCKECVHCAKMLQWEDDYLCTFGGECNWMSGYTAMAPTDCDLFITVDEYLEQMDGDNTEN